MTPPKELVMIFTGAYYQSSTVSKQTGRTVGLKITSVVDDVITDPSRTTFLAALLF